MLNFSGLTRYSKKSKTLDRYKELETNLLQHADKVFDIFCYDNRQKSHLKLHMARKRHLMIMLFLKIKKQNSRLHVWQKYQNFGNFLIIQLSQVTLNLNLFLVGMLLQKQQNLCQRVQYILYLQYNKQWYQIVHYIYLLNFLPFRIVAFLITNCVSNSYFSNFVLLHLSVLLNWTVQSKLFLN